MTVLVRLVMRLMFAVSMGGLLPVGAQACSYGGAPLSQAQLDEKYRRDVAELPELFEAEVLQVDGPNSEMRVLRVFRGQLRPGMVLRGQPSRDTCTPRPLRAGDRGFVLIGFGPNGPSFAGRFLNETAVNALRRIGALPVQ